MTDCRSRMFFLGVLRVRVSAGACHGGSGGACHDGGSCGRRFWRACSVSSPCLQMQERPERKESFQHRLISLMVFYFVSFSVIRPSSGLSMG